MEQKTMDMTRGPILKQMSVFALPVLLGMLCQRIYNFADVYIVGRYLGDNALAAVSISGVVMYLLFSLIMGLTTGVSVVISQYYGAKNEQGIRATFVSSVYVALAGSILITLLGLVTLDPLLRILQTSEELMGDAKAYMYIIYAGSFATMLYNWISAVLRSLGNSVIPFVFIIVSSILNVVLDIAFVSWIPMGVAGAAIATVLSQLISGITCLIYALKVLPVLRMKRREFGFQREISKQILVYGMPTALQMSIISISDLALQGVVNTYGTAMIVAYGVCTKVEGLGFQLADAIGTAVGTFTGQNIGAGDLERVEKGVNTGYLMNVICYGLFCPVVFLLASPIMKAFTDHPDSIRYGAEYMRMFSLFFLAGGILVVYHNVLRASGDVSFTVLIGVSEVVVRICCAFLFPKLFGYFGLWLVSPITWLCAMGVGGGRYYSGRWKNKAGNVVGQRGETR